MPDIAGAAARAAARFPWYGAMLTEAGFFENADLGHVPLLREEALVEHYYASNDAPAVANPGDRVYLTSGTATGVPKRVVWTADDHSAYVSQRAALFRSLIGGDCRTAVADLGTGHAAASAAEIFEALNLEGHDISIDLPIEKHVELLREWRPDVLYTMPMILERLIGTGASFRAPRWIFVLGDLAPPEWRASVEHSLGMAKGHIVDLLGSIEVGAIAYSQGLTGGYVFHEQICAEAIEPDDPRSDGGKLLVLTSLTRDGFPAVRYVAGDLVAGFNGRGYERHLGRSGSELKHGEMLSMPAIAAAIASVSPGTAWSVRRRGLECVIDIDDRAYSPAVAERIRTAIRQAHPSVDRMIRSRLVGDIDVEPRAFPDSAYKRTVR